jgi:hypothetical protein
MNYYIRGNNMNANFKDGVIRNGTAIGAGTALGNIKDGVIRNGFAKGSGTALGNVKDGVVRNGSMAGTGSQIGKVSDFSIKGMERELDSEIVACYHFLVKKII